MVGQNCGIRVSDVEYVGRNLGSVIKRMKIKKKRKKKLGRNKNRGERKEKGKKEKK